MIGLKKVFNLCTKINLKLDRHSKTLRRSIFGAIDQTDEAKGGLNFVILAKSLGQLKDEMFCRINALGKYLRIPSPYKVPPLHVVKSDIRTGGTFLFHYKGTLWCIPMF